MDNECGDKDCNDKDCNDEDEDLSDSDGQSLRRFAGQHKVSDGCASLLT